MSVPQAAARWVAPRAASSSPPHAPHAPHARAACAAAAAARTAVTAAPPAAYAAPPLRHARRSGAATAALGPRARQGGGGVLDRPTTKPPPGRESEFDLGCVRAAAWFGGAARVCVLRAEGKRPNACGGAWLRAQEAEAEADRAAAQLPRAAAQRQLEQARICRASAAEGACCVAVRALPRERA
jgi:hypothetical protein